MTDGNWNDSGGWMPPEGNPRKVNDPEEKEKSRVENQGNAGISATEKPGHSPYLQQDYQRPIQQERKSVPDSPADRVNLYGDKSKKPEALEPQYGETRRLRTSEELGNLFGEVKPEEPKETLVSDLGADTSVKPFDQTDSSDLLGSLGGSGTKNEQEQRLQHLGEKDDDVSGHTTLGTEQPQEAEASLESFEEQKLEKKYGSQQLQTESWFTSEAGRVNPDEKGGSDATVMDPVIADLNAAGSNQGTVGLNQGAAGLNKEEIQRSKQDVGSQNKEERISREAGAVQKQNTDAETVRTDKQMKNETNSETEIKKIPPEQTAIGLNQGLPKAGASAQQTAGTKAQMAVPPKPASVGRQTRTTEASGGNVNFNAGQNQYQQQGQGQSQGQQQGQIPQGQIPLQGQSQPQGQGQPQSQRTTQQQNTNRNQQSSPADAPPKGSFSQNGYGQTGISPNPASSGPGFASGSNMGTGAAYTGYNTGAGNRPPGPPNFGNAYNYNHGPGYGGGYGGPGGPGGPGSMAMGRPPKKSKGIWILLGILIVFLILVVIGVAACGDSSDYYSYAPNYDYIATVYVEGTIASSNTSSFGYPVGYQHNWTLNQIDYLMSDVNNKGMILYVDSPGGGVFESDELYLKIKEYKEISGKPVYAYMGSMAASGGYYVSAPADKIFANRNTWTGSIGVTMGTFFDISEFLERYGIKSQTITSGANKAMGSSVEPMTEQQRAIFQSLIDEAYDQFVGIVSEERGIALDRAKTIADGRIYTAKQALNLDLIDEIGTFEEALADMRSSHRLRDAVVIDVYYEVRGSLFWNLLGDADLTHLYGGGEAGAILDLVDEKSRYPISYLCDWLQ